MMDSFAPFLNSKRLTIFMSASNWRPLSILCGNEFNLSETARIEQSLTICGRNIPISYL